MGSGHHREGRNRGHREAGLVRLGAIGRLGLVILALIVMGWVEFLVGVKYDISDIRLWFYIGAGLFILGGKG